MVRVRTLFCAVRSVPGVQSPGRDPVPGDRPNREQPPRGFGRRKPKTPRGVVHFERGTARGFPALPPPGAIMSPNELPVIQKTYDLLKWTNERVARFPRPHRHELGSRLLAALHDLFDVLLAAKYTRDRGALLDRANLLVEQLRFRVRLAFDLGCLRATGYGFASGELDAVGRMLGGWRRANGLPIP